MAVPGINELLVPFLEAIKDGQPHTRAAIKEALAAHFKLTEKDLQQRQGNNTLVIVNHMAWCDVHLCDAGFAAKTENRKDHQLDTFTITERGLYELTHNRDKIRVSYLNQFKKP